MIVFSFYILLFHHLTMLKTLIITGLLFFTPASSLAYTVVQTDNSGIDYAPCAHITDVLERYQCRRYEAMTQVRIANDEFRRYSRPTIITIKQELATKRKQFYMKKSTEQERVKFEKDLKAKSLQKYKEWYVGEQEMLQARRNLRMATRLPNNQELRMALIQQKGVFLDVKGNQKKTRRTIVEDQIEYMKSFKNAE